MSRNRGRRRHGPEIHVGLISGLAKVTEEQKQAICLALSRMDSDDGGGRPVLHHGCGPGADVVAHLFVRRRGGWLVHGHPASDVIASHGIVDILDARNKSEGRGRRDASILAASSIILVVLPCPRYSPVPGQPDLPTMIRAAESAGKRIIYIKEAAGRQGSPATQGTALKPAAGAAPPSLQGNDAGKPDRQGENGTLGANRDHGPRRSTRAAAGDRRAVSQILNEWEQIAVRTLGTRAEVHDSATSVVVVLMVDGKEIDEFPVPEGRDKALKYVRTFDAKAKRHRVHAPELLVDEWR